uniref:Putative secreted protein n=1 Tax=Xenopsylla cheopis TaxID=163159 RepID=A0A6M2DXU2_XENCH
MVLNTVLILIRCTFSNSSRCCLNSSSSSNNYISNSKCKISNKHHDYLIRSAKLRISRLFLSRQEKIENYQRYKTLLIWIRIKITAYSYPTITIIIKYVSVSKYAVIYVCIKCRILQFLIRNLIFL